MPCLLYYQGVHIGNGRISFGSGAVVGKDIP